MASLVLGFIVSVLASPLHPRAASSTQQPVDVTYKIEPFTQAAGLVQQTYCSPSSYEPGLQLGDATFLWRIGDGDQRQRVNLYHSESLGIAVAIQGTNGSSTRSILNDFQYNPFDPDERYSQYYPKGAKIMNGFQIAYVKLADDIFRALRSSVILRVQPSDFWRPWILNSGLMVVFSGPTCLACHALVTLRLLRL